jgi:hypothetical protein
MDEPRAIIRPDDTGAIDEVVIDCTNIHLERMSDDCWCLIVDRGTQQAIFDICRKGKEVLVTLFEDGLGCADDRPRREDG